MPDAIARHTALDQRLVQAVRGIRLLTLASWPASVQSGFLQAWRQGRAVLPQVDYRHVDCSQARAELEAVAAAADPQHPLGIYLRQSAASWDSAARLLESLGTPAACPASMELFGRPDTPLPGDGPTAREAAHHF